MDYVIKLKFPGVQKYGCKKKNGGYKPVWHNGWYVKEYIPEEKCLKLVVPNCEKDPMKANNGIHRMYMSLLNMVHQNTQSGNEYVLKSWITNSYCFYCQCIRNAGNARIAGIWRNENIRNRMCYSQSTGTCAMSVEICFPDDESSTTGDEE